MISENLRAAPYALIGAATGICRYVIKPFLMEETERTRKVASAAIYYYRTGGEDENQSSDKASPGPVL